MSGSDKLFDTNILIYLSKNQLPLIDVISPDDNVYISVITYMEALGFPFQSAKEEAIISKLCENLILLNLSEQIIHKVIEIRKTKKIKLPDAIIAASALHHNLTLITRNTADFSFLAESISIVDPIKL
jgi:predicted nucleic acid-binding protein